MRKIWIAAAVYVCVFSLLEIDRWRIWSFGSDTGTFTQAILAASEGFRDGPEGGSHFFFHFSPILAALYPLVAVTRTPLALQLAQVVLVALTAPAIFALFRPYVEAAVASKLALLTLVYPPLASLAFGEFHELAFFPASAIGLVWAADRCRWGWFALFAAACVLTREDVCLELAAIGVGVALLALARRGENPSGLLLGRPRQPSTAAFAFALLGVSGAVVAGLYYHFVVTMYGRWPHGHFYDYSFAQGPLAVAAAIFTQPLVALPALFQFGRLSYLVEALAPLLFFPLRSPWFFGALPGLVIVLLASEPSVWRMGNHYAALWAPWMLVAAGAAIAGMSRRFSSTVAHAWSNAAIAACIVVLAAFNPMHIAHYLTAPYGDLASARAALACVPRDATVATHDEWFAQIAADRPNATIQSTDAPYLVYADDFPNDRFHHVLMPAIQKGVRAGRYQIVCSYGRVRTYRRR